MGLFDPRGAVAKLSEKLLDRSFETRRFHHRIAIVFDFDLTLGPATLDSLVQHCGSDPDECRRTQVDPLREAGWEEILAEVYALTELSRTLDSKITQETLAEVGRALPVYEGVKDTLASLIRTCKSIDQDLELEFHILSSGLYDVIANTQIASLFESVRGTRLHYSNGTGAIEFPTLIISHPEKVRYLLAMCKGLDPSGPNAPSHVFQDVPEEDWRVPFDQVIYVGDGVSDMPVFRMLNERGGTALGLYKTSAQAWSGRPSTDANRRLQNLTPTDFRQNSELRKSLKLAVQSAAARAALRKMSIGE